MTAKPVHRLQISPALKTAAARLVREEGVSLDYWINMAIAQKLGSSETAGYYRRRFGQPRADDLRSVLDRVPDNPPAQDDEVSPEIAAMFKPG